MIGQTPDYVEEPWQHQEREAEEERRRLRIETKFLHIEALERSSYVIEGRMKSVMAKTYKVQFIGRKIGAVGDCWPIAMEVKAEKRIDIADILHETYEHIRSLETKEVYVEDPWKLI